MTNKNIIVTVFFSLIIVGFFSNNLAIDLTVMQPTKLSESSLKGSIKDIELLPNKKLKIEDNLLDIRTDTLRNHDRTPSFYYLQDSTYYTTRLTVPNYVASVCSVKSIRFALYRPRTATATLCSLFVWSDTVINDIHRPNNVKLRGLYYIPTWPVGYYTWLTLQLSQQLIFENKTSFWLGFFCPTTEINILADGSENLDTCRNAIKQPNGNWTISQYDFLQEAIIKYAPVDSNLGVCNISNVNKILTGNTNVNIMVGIRNYGVTTIDAGIPVILSITGPSLDYETTGYTSLSISANETTNIYFPFQFLNTTGEYQITARVMLNNDPIPDNDSMQFNTFVYTHGLMETFWSQFPPPGWTVFNFNGNNQWGKVNYTFYADSYCTRILYDPIPYAPNNDWLITPRFRGAPNDSIIFWYRAASSEFYETLLVRINTSSNNLDTSNFSQIIDIVSTNNTHWQYRIIPLNSVITETTNLFIAFHYPCNSNFYIAIDNVILPELDTSYFDFYPISINSPKIPIVTDSSYTPTAIIRNNSTSLETPGLYVFYEISGNFISYLESVWVGISGGNSENVKFPSFSPNIADTVLIKVWTSSALDDNLSNDTISRRVFIAPKFQIPSYTTNFNEGWGPNGDNPPLGGWRIIQGGGDAIWNTNDWHKDTLRIGDSLRQVAMIYYSPIENAQDRLISPRFDCSSPGTYIFKFWHWYRDYDHSIPDSGVILVSTNDGLTWPIRIVRYFNISDSGYRNFPLNVAGNSAVRICFLYGAYNEYWWAVDDFSVIWIPTAPLLISPVHRYQTQSTRILFTWQEIPNASSYEIQIAYDSLFEVIRKSDTISTAYDSITLEPGNFWWRVRAGTPFGAWSEPRTFWILQTGWLSYPDIPNDATSSGKMVKDGGALVFCPIDSSIYAFKGNNTRDFFAYRISQHFWQVRQSIGTDTLKKRNIKKGSALCFGDSMIYAVKGNSNEFWAYNPKSNIWTQKKNIPEYVLKGGTGIVYVPEIKIKNKTTDNTLSSTEKNVNSNRIYLLKGTNKNFEFWMYSFSEDSWIKKSSAPTGPYTKPFKDGSALVYDGMSTIYALKGGSKINEFYSYDINADTWSLYPGDTLPQKRPPDFKKKSKVKQGGAMTLCDNMIYAIKGGGSNEFWRYSESAGVKIWIPCDTIPRYSSQSVPKAGASLTSALGYIYLLKGNKTLEFWAWIPQIKKQNLCEREDELLNIKRVSSNLHAGQIDNKYDFTLDIKPNPCHQFASISYSIPSSALVSIKLYNINGQVLQEVNKGFLNVGHHNQKFVFQNLTSGVYFIGLEADQQRIISKIIIQ